FRALLRGDLARLRQLPGGRQRAHGAAPGGTRGGCLGAGAIPLQLRGGARLKASTYPMLAAEEAARLVLERTPVLGSEEVGLAEATGRVAAEDVVARRMLPAFPASAVDGYAIRSADGGGRLRVAGESAA